MNTAIARPNRPPWWTSRRAAWLGALVISAIALQAGHDVYLGYVDVKQGIQRDLQAQARIIAEQTARGMQAVDIALANLAERLSGEPELMQTESALRELLTKQAGGLVQTDGLVVFDAQGGLLATSLALRASVPPISAAGRPVFEDLRTGRGTALQVDNVTASPVTGSMSFPMGRRIGDASGRFLGVVGARGKVEYFQRFYRESFGDQEIRISLMHRDGWLLARHPSTGDMLGRRLAVLDSLLPRDGLVSATVARLPSPVDGADHFVALQLVPGYPLVIAVSREAVTALADWRAQAMANMLRTGVLCALAALLLWTTLRQLNALHAARNSLQVSEERYAIAMEGSQGGHWVYDTDSDVLYSSEAVNRLFGLNPQARSMPRMAYYSLLPIHPEDRARLVENSDAVIHGHTDRLEQEYRINLHDGEHWILTRAQRFLSTDGGGARVAGVSVDITERKRLETERERMGDELRRAQRLEAIGTLAGGIAHDFNNILATILGHGELAQRRLAPDEAARTHIDTCMRAGQRAKSLVERILAFARGGTGERVVVDVQTTVHEVVESLEHRLTPGSLVELDLRDDGYAVVCDPIQIHQVILNLCGNAIEAMAKGGRLGLQLRHVHLNEGVRTTTGPVAAGHYLQLEVSDEGVGIDAAVLDRIFDPFFTTRGAGVGTGLGLSLVHGIVTDMGGGIDVYSKPGWGSRFTVLLPASEGKKPVREHDQLVDPDEQPGDGQVVLVLDDESSLVSLTEDALAERGYEPVGCTHPAEALDLLRADPMRFDLVITDEAMPDMRGTEFARCVRDLREDLPILLVSGFVSPRIAREAKRAGVTRILDKPLSIAQLDIAVAQALAAAPSIRTVEEVKP
jgi:PAS domain S-box-containing protein